MSSFNELASEPGAQHAGEALVRYCRERLRQSAKRSWIRLNFMKPYIDTENKLLLAAYVGENPRQITDWLTNFRARAWRKQITSGDITTTS